MGGIDSESISVVMLHFCVLSIETGLYRLNEKTRKELYYVFFYGEDWHLAKNLFLSANLNFVLVED